MSFFDAISFQTSPPWQEGLSSTGAPYSTAPVERIQFSPNVVVTKEIRSKIGHFPLCVSFWLPLYRSNREKSLPREHFPASPLARRELGLGLHGGGYFCVAGGEGRDRTRNRFVPRVLDAPWQTDLLSFLFCMLPCGGGKYMGPGLRQ